MRFFKLTGHKILNVIYSIPRFIIISSYGLTLRIKIFNSKKIPRDHSAILAFNHTTGADPLIVLGAFKKKIYFVADSERFSNRLTSFFMRRFTDSIPIFKQEFQKNIRSFRELFIISKGNKVFFGIFPEGELFKNGTFGKFKNGAAYLSYKTKLPIIPVYLHNLHKGPAKGTWFDRHPVFEGISSIVLNTFRRVHVIIGDPIDPMAESIMEDFKEMTDKKEYRIIINNITAALEEEFKELREEADELIQIKPANIPLEKLSKTSNKEHHEIPGTDGFEIELHDGLDDDELAHNAGNAK
jgi:1-acyl-sn-glycerol-3-phosphate acyltransferase